jgi:hypothetical protein
VTVQVLPALWLRLLGLQASPPESCPSRLRVAVLDPPFHVPVMVVSWLLGIVAAAVTLKAELVAPAATVTVAGTVNSGLLLDNDIAIPPAGAAIFSVAEHVENWPPFRPARLQIIDESAGTAMMPPALFNVGSSEPVASTPAGFAIPIDVVVGLAAIVSWTLATTPAGIVFVFKPVSTQVNRPATRLHDKVFPAAVAAGPAVPLMAEI